MHCMLHDDDDECAQNEIYKIKHQNRIPKHPNKICSRIKRQCTLKHIHTNTHEGICFIYSCMSITITRQMVMRLKEDN